MIKREISGLHASPDGEEAFSRTRYAAYPCSTRYQASSRAAASSAVPADHRLIHLAGSSHGPAEAAIPCAVRKHVRFAPRRRVAVPALGPAGAPDGEPEPSPSRSRPPAGRAGTRVLPGLSSIPVPVGFSKVGGVRDRRRGRRRTRPDPPCLCLLLRGSVPVASAAQSRRWPAGADADDGAARRHHAAGDRGRSILRHVGARHRLRGRHRGIGRRLPLRRATAELRVTTGGCLS